MASFYGLLLECRPVENVVDLYYAITINSWCIRSQNIACDSLYMYNNFFPPQAVNSVEIFAPIILLTFYNSAWVGVFLEVTLLVFWKSVNNFSSFQKFDLHCVTCYVTSRSILLSIIAPDQWACEKSLCYGINIYICTSILIVFIDQIQVCSVGLIPDHWQCLLLLEHFKLLWTFNEVIP